MTRAWPEAEEIEALFARFIRGDLVAQSDFIAAVLEPLAEHLARYRRDADDHACLSAAEDAVLALIRTPQLYDPARGRLLSFLRMAAERDLQNALVREQRQRGRREPGESVELLPDERNTPAEGAADLPGFDDPALAVEIASFSEMERRVLDLMRQGERRTSAFAAVLKIADLDPDEQARAVKREKDKLVLRLKRAVRRDPAHDSTVDLTRKERKS